MKPPRKRALERRTFLRGTLLGGGAVALGLPLLEAMLDEHGEALAQGAALPRRFVSWFFGNGVNLNKFEPDQPGASTYTLGPLLQPLADLKDYLTVCTGIMNRTRVLMPTHHEGLCAFTGYDFIRTFGGGFSSDFGGPTIDQVIADRIAATPGGAPPIHSLQFQVSKQFSPADSGATSQFLSARGAPGSLLFRRGATNPHAIWGALFGGAVAPDAVRASMLDFLKRDIGNLRARLGAKDNIRMESHLDGIRALELRIQGSRAACTGPAEDPEENQQPNGEENVTHVNQLMADLFATAVACDLTRVGSVLFLPLAGEVSLTQDMAETRGRTHHMWSHNPTALGSSGATVDGLTGYEQNIRYIMDRFGDWMRALRAHTEPDGVTTLLDTTILYASSDCSWGQNHMINRQPILLGGHGRGHLKFPGIHFQAVAGDSTIGTLNDPGQPAARNMSDVLFTCLRAFDPAAPSVGDLTGAGTPPGSSTPLAEIEAS